ncbi:MAG: glycosyltransferase family 39 protein [Phenylobacterium sp.]|nr:glycosyltransferase family 39 protein [Phenylobacterium sp.]MDP3175515.1 glycosyltransferase family 39 protein [Phenylobacterium sp.]
MTASDTRASGVRAIRARHVLVVAASLALAALAFERVWLIQGLPLWWDETWTGAIASTPDWRAFWREAYLDVNAPLYYVVMRLWTSVFGVSDIALRAPSLIAVAAAAAVPLIIRIDGLTREARLTWAVLVFAWWGGFATLLDARCYALVLALSALQCALFIRLLARPTRARAWAWAAVGACAVLTHYYAAFIGLTQGLIYLGLHRGRALRTWPAALAFTPAFAWLAHHGGRLAQYVSPSVDWHAAVSWDTALPLATATVGPEAAAFLAAVVLVLGLGWLTPRLLGAAAADEASAPTRDLALAAISGLAALALALLSGVATPSLTGRYLFAYAPAVLLGVVLCARASKRAHLVYLALIGLYLAVLPPPAQIKAVLTARSAYGFQAASELLMAGRARDVVFVWDHSAAPVIASSSLARVGGFFFARAGADIAVRPLRVDPRHDPNTQILAAANGRKPGIIWVYNRRLPSAARAFAPAIDRVDPRWSCVSYGDGVRGTIACLPRPGT